MQKNIFMALMFCSMIAWGISWSGIKIMNEYMPATELVFVRYFITAVALFFTVIVLKQSFMIDKKSFFIAVFIALITVIYGYAVFLGTKLGTASLAGAFINTFSPIITFIILIFIYKRKIYKLDICALSIGFVGTMLMLGLWQFDLSKIVTPYNLYFILGALLWSILTIASSKAKVNMVVFSFYMYTFTSLFSAFFADFDTIVNASVDLRFWLSTLFVSVVSTAIASTIFFLGTRKIGADGVSSFMFVTPISAIGFGVFALDEKLGFFTFVGISMAILAVYMLNRIGIFKR
ncbi:MAG: DMT family transporter [Campylobacteraceae bacterium]|jgi:drug/metabolite transporter (DMT)-like permease|nr:DMT family transporter [Campylobacteraceae bacterium]